MAQTGHPLILFEDDHLLVVNKPAGVNTHSPGPYAGEGLYDWLRHREPRWAQLAIIHRLDKETSGVMVFAKSSLANRSLTQQFTNRGVQKKYLLLTDRQVTPAELHARSAVVRLGDKYVSLPLHGDEDRAETRFRRVSLAGADPNPARAPAEARGHPSKGIAGGSSTSSTTRSGSGRSEAGRTLLEAHPVTGRTHQIRVHAADHGFPILGDTLYGGTPASRLCLHAAELTFDHPATGKPMTFTSPANFEENTRLALRSAFIDLRETNAYRLCHGSSDGFPGWYVDRLGDFLLSQAEKPLTAEQEKVLSAWLSEFSLRGVYHKISRRHIRPCAGEELSPRHVLGETAPERFIISENGLKFELSLGCSAGLFLDQRDNRRRFLVNHIAADFPAVNAGPRPAEVLNTFAYTCGFSVCAAKAGARVTSLDLSKKYLAWGKRNFLRNAVNPESHDFIYGEVFDWLRRLARKHRLFDLLLLDPPTFSRSRAGGDFQVEKNYGDLVSAALPLVKPAGILFASTNAARLEPERFLNILQAAIASGGRNILRQHYVPQPPDFPVSREEPAYLKTVWLKLG